MQAKVVGEAGKILDIAKGHADAMRVAADHIAYLHNELEDTRAPAYDVATALEILQTGQLGCQCGTFFCTLG